MEDMVTTNKPLEKLVKGQQDECSKGGKHEFETRQGGLGQSYQACAKCGVGPPVSGHLGAH